MPRDLTDLMERATSFAPPETHDAGDITRSAARRHRRRTTGIAGGVAAAVLIAAAAGYGVTRGHASDPEPAAPYRYGMHQKLADAVSSAEASGFRVLPYDAPSVLPAKGHFNAFGEYADIDDQGHLIHVALEGPRESFRSTLAYSVLDGPGQASRPVVAPPVPGAGKEIQGGPWTTTFTEDGRILWRGSQTVDNELENDRVTNDDGSGVQAFTSTLSSVRADTVVGFPTVRDVWIDDGRAYLSLVTAQSKSLKNPTETVSLYQLGAGSAQPRAAEPSAALAIDVSHGTAVWIDPTATTIHAEDLETGAQHVVPMPIDEGCRIPPRQSYFNGVLKLLSTNGDLVALTEYCGEATRIVVTDLRGRLVTDVDAGPKGGLYSATLGERTLTFASVTGSTVWYADDLVTGRLVALGRGAIDGLNNEATSAGRYVLWYDGDGGHVGEFTE